MMAWATLLAIGLLATIAQLQMPHAYKFIGATEGSLLCMLTPVINVLAGMIFFHEPMTGRALFGCVIVLSSCTYAAVSQHIPEGESVA
jgi:drug/metabolite transporter (DMT)-like permease